MANVFLTQGAMAKSLLPYVTAFFEQEEAESKDWYQRQLANGHTVEAIESYITEKNNRHEIINEYCSDQYDKWVTGKMPGQTCPAWDLPPLYYKQDMPECK